MTNPSYCNGAWAFATTAALSDRIKIARKAANPDISLSPQVLLSCAAEGNSCAGGSVESAWDYIKINGITDYTCQAFVGVGQESWATCSSIARCRGCAPGTDCFIPPGYYEYGLESVKKVRGVEAMKEEIWKKGPIVCKTRRIPGLESYRGGVLREKVVEKRVPSEAVEIVGWAEVGGLELWVGKGSYGSHWGLEGFLLVEKGSFGVEENCWAPVPRDTWSQPQIHVTTDQEQLDPRNNITN